MDFDEVEQQINELQLKISGNNLILAEILTELIHSEVCTDSILLNIINAGEEIKEKYERGDIIQKQFEDVICMSKVFLESR